MDKVLALVDNFSSKITMFFFRELWFCDFLFNEAVFVECSYT